VGGCVKECIGHGRKMGEETPSTAWRNRVGQRHFIKRKYLRKVFIHTLACHILRGSRKPTIRKAWSLPLRTLQWRGIHTSKHYSTVLVVGVMEKK
jgi:hypothetical protein